MTSVKFECEENDPNYLEVYPAQRNLIGFKMIFDGEPSVVSINEFDALRLIRVLSELVHDITYNKPE